MPTLILPSGRVDGHLAQRGHETTGLATRGTDGSNPPPSSGESTANLNSIVPQLHDPFDTTSPSTLSNRSCRSDARLLGRARLQLDVAFEADSSRSAQAASR
jgi:hypothetical protein